MLAHLNQLVWTAIASGSPIRYLSGNSESCLVCFLACAVDSALRDAGSSFCLGESSLLKRFQLHENHTTVRQELLAGLTTFMTMAYVVVVNPRILSEAGMPVDGVLFATCISAAVATLIMGLWANYPIALAPGMSLNAYFAYSIVLGRGVPWQTALGVVFLSGVLFLVLTLTKVREQIVNGIPDCLKHGTAGGMGLFIAFIGLRNSKIIVASSATFVAFGKISDPQVLLAAIGLIFIAVLMDRRVSSAILLGIFAIAIAGIPLGLTHWPPHLFSLPHPPWDAPETRPTLRRKARPRRPDLRVFLCGPF
jgi:AGZA family xanthine/uracil permease-like MFS transporter